MSRSAAPALELSRLETEGWLSVPPDFLGPEALEKARAAAAALPAWDPGEKGDEARLGAWNFTLGAAEVSGSALSRRSLVMGLGPRQHGDVDALLWGRRAEAPADGQAALAPLAAALGAGVSVRAASVQALYPGHEGHPEGRAAAEPVSTPGLVRAVLLLDDAAPGDGALLVWPGSHRKAAGPVMGTGVFRENLGEPLELHGPAGTLFLFHPGALRGEARRVSKTPARRLSALLAAREMPPPPPGPAPYAGRGPVRRLIQWAKLSVLFPLSRRLRAPLKMVNVGAGRQWQHPSVIALDVDPETNLNQDVTQTGLPFPDGSMDAVYSSHCIEHLLPADALGFLREAHRVLRPGGVLRVVCPDMDRIFDAYDRRDAAWSDWTAANVFTADGWLRSIGRMASALVVDRFTDEQLHALYREGGRAKLMAALDAQAPGFSFQEMARWPDGHRSWWTPARLQAAMREAGFSTTRESARDQSSVPTFRDPRYFDYSSPNTSLYVEAVR